MPRRGKKWSGSIPQIIPTLSRQAIADAVGRNLTRTGIEAVSTSIPITYIVGGIADVMAVKLPAGTVTIVAVKTGVADLYADDMIFNALSGYRLAAHDLYVACEAGAIPVCEVPQPWGVIWVDRKRLACVTMRECSRLEQPDSQAIAMSALRSIVGSLSIQRFGLERSESIAKRA